MDVNGNCSDFVGPVSPKRHLYTPTPRRVTPILAFPHRGGRDRATPSQSVSLINSEQLPGVLVGVCSDAFRLCLCIMRTTVSLDDRLAKQVRQEAASRGMSVSAFISRTLDDALKRREPSEQPPFRLVTVRGVHLRPGVDLDRPRSLDTGDDESLFQPSRC